MDLPGPFKGRVLVAALVTAGLGYTVLNLGKGVSEMEGQHWVMLAVILVVGYVLGRLWATPAALVGLP